MPHDETMRLKIKTHQRLSPAVMIFGVVFCLSFGSLFASETIIVAFGDSTTAPRGKLQVFTRLLESELALKEVDTQIINSGVGGNNTNQARKRFQKDVLTHRPDVVIIQFGINDAAVDVWKKPPATVPRVDLELFEENLTHFVTTLQSKGSEVILMTPNPCRWTSKLKELYGKPPYQPDQVDGFNVLLSEYANAARRIAKQNDAALIDVYRLFQDYDKQPQQAVDDLLLDGIHPNADGHRLIAELILKQLTKHTDD